MDHTPDGRAAAAPDSLPAQRRSAGALPDDSTLVARLRDRDEDTFTHLVDAWTPTMMHVARTRVSTAESAAEVVQDTWLAVLTGIDRFEARSSLRTWVFRILLNKATTRGAREARTVPWSTLEGDDGGPTVDPTRFRGPDDQYPGGWRSFPRQWPSPEGEAVRAEVSSVVAEAVRSLPSRQRLVVILRDLVGYTSEEVCALLEVSAANQRVLLHRARAALRLRLEELFGVDARWEATT